MTSLGLIFGILITVILTYSLGIVLFVIRIDNTKKYHVFKNKLCWNNISFFFRNNFLRMYIDFIMSFFLCLAFFIVYLLLELLYIKNSNDENYDIIYWTTFVYLLLTLIYFLIWYLFSKELKKKYKLVSKQMAGNMFRLELIRLKYWTFCEEIDSINLSNNFSISSFKKLQYRTGCKYSLKSFRKKLKKIQKSNDSSSIRYYKILLAFNWVLERIIWGYYLTNDPVERDIYVDGMLNNCLNYIKTYSFDTTKNVNNELNN